MNAAIRRLEGTAPLVIPAVGLLGGITLDHVWGLPTAACAAAFALAGCGVVLRPVRRYALLWVVGLAAAALGAMLHNAHARRLPPSSIAHHVRAPFELVRIRGRVVDPPRFTPPDEGFVFSRWMRPAARCSWVLEAEGLAAPQGEIQVTGRVRIGLAEPLLDIRAGQRVEVFGRLRAFPGRRNPGGFDAAEFYRREGICAALECESALNVRRLDGGRENTALTAPLTGFRDWWRRLLMEDWPAADETQRGFIETMVLGHRSALDRRVDRLFADLGLAHVLAVSGAHVAALIGGAWGLARLLSLRRSQAAWLMFAVTALYAFIAEPRAPILRAVIAAALICLGGWFHLRPRPVNLMAAAALILALIDPLQTLTPGFQLSFVAAAGIVLLVPAGRPFQEAVVGFIEDLIHGPLVAELRRRVRAVRRRHPRVAPATAPDAWSRVAAFHEELHPLTWRILRAAIGLPLWVSICAWAATAPLVAWHFHQVQYAGPLNTLVIWAPTALLVNLGFAAMLVSVIAPEAALPIKWVMSGLEVLILRLAEALPAGFPWVASMPRPSMAWMVLWYGMLGAFACVFRPDRSALGRHEALPELAPEGPARRRPSLSACLLIALLAGNIGLAAYARGGRGAGDVLRVAVLSVDDGLAAVIELADGRTFLYDAGSDAPYDVGGRTLVPYLRSRSIDRVDRVYISHPNLDHFSGLPGLTEAMPVGEVLVTPYFLRSAETQSPSRDLVKWMAARGRPLRTQPAGPARWQEGGVTFEQLWPAEGLPATVSANETSMVLRLTYAGRSILLTGDIEQAAQRALVEAGDGRCDVLLLPHHGSTRTAYPGFVDAVDPDVIVWSSGSVSAKTRELLAQGKAPRMLCNTAEVGAVMVELSAKGVRVYTGGEATPMPAPHGP